MSFDAVTNPQKPTTTHDPEATLDYRWGLEGTIDDSDLITGATFSAHVGDPTGIVAAGVTVSLGSIEVSGKAVWGWLSIPSPADQTAMLGKTIAVTCHYTTAAARIDDRTLYFKIKDR